MPMIPEAAHVILASSGIGAVHLMVFAGFSAQSLKDRIAVVQSALVVSANEGRRGEKVMALETPSTPPLQISLFSHVFSLPPHRR